jgi:pimeloyl-ACP methyl ester carboxylesterase
MTVHTHDTAPTQFVEASGISFAYRRFGNPDAGRPPIVFFQHFIGNLDDHDPAISDGFATDREVILFNNTGVASTSGLVPDTIQQMATDAATFIDALGVTRADLVGHSMGGLVAQTCGSRSGSPRPRPARSWDARTWSGS